MGWLNPKSFTHLLNGIGQFPTWSDPPHPIYDPRGKHELHLFISKFQEGHEYKIYTHLGSVGLGRVKSNFARCIYNRSCTQRRILENATQLMAWVKNNDMNRYQDCLRMYTSFQWVGCSPSKSTSTTFQI